MKTVRKEVGRTFSERVVELALSVPPGRVTTYGAIARAAGGGARQPSRAGSGLGQAARSVTAILAKAYDAGKKDIPFHRIVYAGGKVWLNNEYKSRRLALYKKEGIELDTKGFIKNFDDIVVEFR